jgi:hypothetical protein
MPVWGWILIGIAALVVAALVVWQMLARRRTAQLRERFGPEYSRVAGKTGSRREAEAELTAREARRDALDIRPLPAASRARYLESWKSVQSRFVDDPRGALDEAHGLLQDAMGERGYPTADFAQRSADVSVDHPRVVENYREGFRLAQTDTGSPEQDTENLRRAMQHYRALFDELVGDVPEHSAA